MSSLGKAKVADGDEQPAYVFDRLLVLWVEGALYGVCESIGHLLQRRRRRLVADDVDEMSGIAGGDEAKRARDGDDRFVGSR